MAEEQASASSKLMSGWKSVKAKTPALKKSLGNGAMLAAATVKDKVPDVVDFARKVGRAVFPQSFISFLKNPSCEAIEHDPTILLSCLSVLSILKSPKYAVLEGLLKVGVDQAMKSPQALRHVENAKVAATGHVIHQATDGLVDLPPEILREAVKYISLKDVVNVMNASGVSPTDIAKMGASSF